MEKFFEKKKEEETFNKNIITVILKPDVYIKKT